MVQVQLCLYSLIKHTTVDDDEDVDKSSNHPSEGSEELIESEIEDEKAEEENIDSDEEIEKYIEYDSDENEVIIDILTNSTMCEWNLL